MPDRKSSRVSLTDIIIIDHCTNFWIWVCSHRNLILILILCSEHCLVWTVTRFATGNTLIIQSFHIYWTFSSTKRLLWHFTLRDTFKNLSSKHITSNCKASFSLDKTRRNVIHNHSSGGSRISPRRERQLPGGGGANIRFCQIFLKTVWNWNNLDRGGVPRVPLDPPLHSITCDYLIHDSLKESVW